MTFNNPDQIEALLERLTTAAERIANALDDLAALQLSRPIAAGSSPAPTAPQLDASMESGVGVVTQELVADLVRECERAMKQRDDALANPTKRGSDGRTHDTTFEHILRVHLDPTYSYYRPHKPA